jgi:hypothetical protein
MSSDAHATAVILIDETYHFSVDVGDQTSITCTQSAGSVRIQIPYNGQSLRPHIEQPSVLDLGTLRLHFQASPQIEECISVQLPAESLLDRIKQGMRYVWEGTYQLDPPNDTLIAVDGTVFDGADISPTDGATGSNGLQDLLFGQTDVFVSDLRLQLSLWVPNLFEQSRLGNQADALRAMLIEQESPSQILLPDATDVVQIARSFVALANSAGGRILLGVKPSGEAIGVLESLRGDRLKTILLKAALRCTPPVPFSHPTFILPMMES